MPGGAARKLTPAKAARVLERTEPSGPAESERLRQARELLADVARLDAAVEDSRKRIAAAVVASGTTRPGSSASAPSWRRSSWATPATSGASPPGLTSPPTPAPPPSRLLPATCAATACPGGGTAG